MKDENQRKKNLAIEHNVNKFEAMFRNRPIEQNFIVK